MKKLIVWCGAIAVVGCQGKNAGPALPTARYISPPGADHANAQISPDGSNVYWWAPTTGGQFQLWTAPTDLSDSTALAARTGSVTPMIWSPNGSQIAVSVTGGGGIANVAVMPSAEKGGGGTAGAVSLLVHNPAVSIPVGWNPDGDRIAYAALSGSASGGTVSGFVTSVAHGGVSPLVPDETHPNLGLWSPDGSRIAYMMNDSGKATLWIADSIGGHRHALTTEGFEILGATIGYNPFSPDGGEIVYVSSRTGTNDIWVVPVDSGAPRQLTHDVRNDDTPFWSPDGRSIAFISDRGRQTDIWVMPSAGGTPVRVTNDPDVESLIGWVDHSDTLAYLTGTGTSSIWSLSLGDSGPRQLTPDSIVAGCCAVSPDGKHVAFSIYAGGGNTRLAVMPVTGGPWKDLGEMVTTHPNYQWSPDGSKLAFLSDRNGVTQVWVATASGDSARQLTDWPEGAYALQWNADGSGMFFISPHQSRLGDVWRVAIDGGAPVRITNHGAVNYISARSGDPQLFMGVLDSSGQLTIARLGPNGAIDVLPNTSGLYVYQTLRHGDSLIVGTYSDPRVWRSIPVDGRGASKPILAPGDGLGDISLDDRWVLYYVPVGASNRMMLLDRATGKTRDLLSLPDAKPNGQFTPDGKTVIFLRGHNVRRITEVDLSKMLGGGGR